MSECNNIRDELYLRLNDPSPDTSEPTSTCSVTNNYSEDSEDEHVFFKYISRFPDFPIASTVLVSY